MSRDSQEILKGSAFEALVAAAPIGIVIIRIDGIITDFNSAAERLFRYPAVEVIGQNISKLMPEPYRSQHDEFIRRYLQTGANQVIGIGREVRAMRSNGRSFWCHLSVCEVRTEAFHLFIGMLTDISRYKVHQQELSEHQKATTLQTLDLIRRCQDLESQLEAVRRQSSDGDENDSDRRRGPAGSDRDDRNTPDAICNQDCILIVDDDETALLIVKRILDSCGRQYQVATGGLAAVRLVAERMLQGSDYRAVLLDLRMSPLDGVQTAVALRQIGYQGQIIGFTADVFSAQKLMAEGCPIDRWVLKPFTKHELLEAVDAPPSAAAASDALT